MIGKNTAEGYGNALVAFPSGHAGHGDRSCGHGLRKVHRGQIAEQIRPHRFPATSDDAERLRMLLK